MMTHFFLIFLFYISFINSMDYGYDLDNVFLPKNIQQPTYKKITKLSKKLPIKLYKEGQNQEKKTNHTKTILTPHSHTIFDILPQHITNNPSSIIKHNTTYPIIQNMHLNKYHIAIISTASVVLFYCAYQKKIQEKLDSFKKHNKKNLIRDNLKDIAHLSKKEFQLITPKRLEELFLPHNLDLINDVYTFFNVGCEHVYNRYHDGYYGTKKFYIGNVFYQTDFFDQIYAEDTLLSLSCKYDNFEVFQWLLEHNADPNIRGTRKNLSYVIGDSPLLHCLHLWRNPERLKQYLTLLLKHKANPNVYSYIDLLPYHCHKSGFRGTAIGRLLNNIKCGRYNEKCDICCELNFCARYNPFPLYDCIKLLIKHDAVLYHELNSGHRKFRENVLLYYETNDNTFPPFKPLLFGIEKIDSSSRIYSYLDMCKYGKRNKRLEMLSSIFEELFFEGFDPNKKIIDAHLPLFLSAILYTRTEPYEIEYPEGSGKFRKENNVFIAQNSCGDEIAIKKCFKLARSILAYGHSTKDLISQYNDELIDKLSIKSIGEKILDPEKNKYVKPDKEDLFNNLVHVFDTLVDEEYEFRKSFLGNPEGLFLELIKRCKRPELWIERIKDEIRISPAQQNKIIWQICSQTLSLLYNMMQGEKNDFAMDDLAKTSMFLVEKISTSEGKTDFDKSVCKLTAKILLDTVHKLHEGSETLYMSTKPLIDCLFEHPNLVNWLKKKEGKNILHVLALNCINAHQFLQKIEKYTENNKNEKLRQALKQPMNSSFTHDTHTTPLYIATQRQKLEMNDVCGKTVDLLEKIEKNLNIYKAQDIH